MSRNDLGVPQNGEDWQDAENWLEDLEKEHYTGLERKRDGAKDCGGGGTTFSCICALTQSVVSCY